MLVTPFVIVMWGTFGGTSTIIPQLPVQITDVSFSRLHVHDGPQGSRLQLALRQGVRYITRASDQDRGKRVDRRNRLYVYKVKSLDALEAIYGSNPF